MSVGNEIASLHVTKTSSFQWQRIPVMIRGHCLELHKSKTRNLKDGKIIILMSTWALPACTAMHKQCKVSHYAFRVLLFKKRVLYINN